MRTALRILMLLPVAALSCLKPDDRPPPGELMITVSPSDAVMNGTVTEDGWALTFSKAIASLGHVGFGGRHMEQGTCDPYSVARYARIFDLRQGQGQKLSEQFALGHCELGYSVTAPGPDTLLGVGVTDDQKTLMRTPGTDDWVKDGGISLMVDGSASRSGVSVGFRWVFRQNVRYDECKVLIDGQPASGVDFVGNQAQRIDIRIELERLFRDDLKSTAKLRFDPFAGADADHDGLVTFAELTQVQLGSLRAFGPYGLEPDTGEEGGEGGVEDSGPPMDWDAGDAGGPHPIMTLADYVYAALFPTVPRFRGDGTCTAAPAPLDGEGYD
jgi:hypothetical protein